MANDLKDFSRRMMLRGRRLEENTSQLVRQVALVADQAIVLGTPVDTGRARSNWIVAINSASETIIEPYFPGEGGSTGARNAQAAIDQGEAVISRYQGGEGVEIHITNNLPYIQRLNDGYSAQAPANYVETAVALAHQQVQLGAKKLGE